VVLCSREEEFLASLGAPCEARDSAVLLSEVHVSDAFFGFAVHVGLGVAGADWEEPGGEVARCDVVRD
jgi:hypothetical protein